MSIAEHDESGGATHVAAALVFARSAKRRKKPLPKGQKCSKSSSLRGQNAPKAPWEATQIMRFQPLAQKPTWGGGGAPRLPHRRRATATTALRTMSCGGEPSGRLSIDGHVSPRREQTIYKIGARVKENMLIIRNAGRGDGALAVIVRGASAPTPTAPLHRGSSLRSDPWRSTRTPRNA